MSKPNIINLNDLLGIDEEENGKNETDNKGTTEINISDLVPFKNHPFKLYEGSRLEEMIESIKEYGIITPLIVRPSEDNKYEILSGHNRANAGKFAGLEKVPVVIREGLTDEEAMLIVTETNLIQRSFSELSHSEKARILTERHEAEKRWGKNSNKINEIEMMSNLDELHENMDFRQLGETHRSDEKLAEEYNTSPRNISRYLRIDKLNEGLKEKLDNGDIPFVSGIDLSYLNEDNQNTLNDLLDEYNYKMDLKKSAEIKKLNKARNLNYNKMNDILSGEYFKKPKAKKNLKLSASFGKKIAERFEDKNMGMKEIEDILLRLIDEYINRERDIGSYQGED